MLAPLDTARPVSSSVTGASPFFAHPAISVIGLGYVGAVSAACFSELGHAVIGIDLDTHKVQCISEGRAPLVEPDLEESIARGVTEGRLSANTSISEAIATTSITFVCVGTPSRPDGSPDLSALEQVAQEIGRALATKADYHLVAVRSTIPVGTTRQLVLPIIERESGKSCGPGFGLCFHPEFLREGVAIADFFAPPKTVIGGYDEASADMLARLYETIDAPCVRTTIEAAEMVKYVDNTWHATKVAFSNEIGKICKSINVDSHEVMGIFVKDTKLNLSPYYMRPGFAFGGSCLPKDLRAMRSIATEQNVSVPLIDSLLRSNDAQIDHAVDLVVKAGPMRVGLLGVTFKSNTDDLRESPHVDLMGRLIARGFSVRVYDENISSAGIRLAAKHAKTATSWTQFALKMLPQLSAPSADELIDWADLVVVCHDTTDFAEALSRDGGMTDVLDLVRLPHSARRSEAYSGICW